MGRLTALPDATAVAGAAAERITSLTEAAIAARGVATIALSGGHTPEPVYQMLVDSARPWRARINWTRVHVYWSDERNVPPDHPDSNFGLANRALLQHVPIPAWQIHRMRGELPAVEAGAEYDALLREGRPSRWRSVWLWPLFIRDRMSGSSFFDVMLLGIGPDAHVASIFPESPLLAGVKNPADLAGRKGPPYTDGAPSDVGRGFTPRHAGQEDSRYAAGVWVPKMNQWRITLTPPALLDSTTIIVLAAGSDKADAIAAALDGELDIARHPAQMLREAGERVDWIIDEAAAVRLRGAPRA